VFAEDQQHLTDLQNEISIKERLIGQLESSQKKLHSLRLQYDEKLAMLEKKIVETELERDKAFASHGQLSVLASILHAYTHCFSGQVEKPGRRAEVGQGARRVRGEDRPTEERIEATSGDQPREPATGEGSAGKPEPVEPAASRAERHAQCQGEPSALARTRLSLKRVGAQVALLRRMKEESARARQVEQQRARQAAQQAKEARRREAELRGLQLDRQRRELVLQRRQEELQLLRRAQRRAPNARRLSDRTLQLRWRRLEKRVRSPPGPRLALVERRSLLCRFRPRSASANSRP